MFSDVDITRGPDDKAVQEGQNVSLSCNVSSNLNVTVSWMRGTQKVSPLDGRYVLVRQDSKFTLIIINAQPGDAGEYRCNASSPEKGLYEVSTPGQVSLNCKCMVQYL